MTQTSEGPPRWRGCADGPEVDKTHSHKQAQFVRSRKTKPACAVLRENVPGSKSRLAHICFKLQRDMATLRREVASLQALRQPKTATIDAEESAAREAAKRKRIEDRAAAKQEHAAAVAKQALIQPEKDRARAEWLAKDAARKRELNRLRTQKWRAANPEKVKAFNDRENRRRKEERAARKQIDASPELLGWPS
jgi:hypothetical protein